MYGVGFAVLWRTRHAPGTIVSWLTIFAIFSHAAFTHLSLFGDDGARLSLLYVVNVVSLVMSLVIALCSFRLPVRQLFLLLIPINLLVLLLALTLDPGNVTSAKLSGALLTHILVSLAAYSALMMAALQSVLLAIQERHLRTPARPMTALLPPLETMEQLLISMLWVGLALLTLAILSGFLFLEDMFAQQVAHHIVITSLSWLVYVGFLGGRVLFGWRGLTAVRWTLVGFTLLVLGYLGSKLVLEYILVS